MIGFALALALAARQAPAIDEAAIERAIDAGRLVQAGDMIAQARAIARKDTQPLLSRLEGQLALAERRDGDAFLAFTRAGGDSSGDCRTREGLGIAALRLGRVLAAINYLNAAVASCPERGAAWNALGVAQDRRANWAASAAAYERATALMPENAQVSNNRGYSLIMQGKYEAAIAVLEASTARAPDNLRTALNLDIARVAAGRPPVPRRPQETDDQWSVRLNNAGYVAYRAGRPDQARTLIEGAIAAHSTSFAAAESNAELVTQESPKP